MKRLSEHTIIGLAACAGVYLFVFIYLQVSSITGFGKKTQFNTYSKLENDEIRINADNIEAGNYSSEDVSNVSRDVNDARSRSSDEWSENNYEGNPDEVAKEVEQQYHDDTGGEERREELMKEHQARLEKLKQEKEKQNQINSANSDQQVAGDVMVEWELSGRSAYKNDNWHVRNPGYTCGYNSSGTVVVKIKVNKNGSVIDAQIENSSSSNASECMKSKAMVYARKSRFNYDSKSNGVQSGYIYYRFISQ